jgi:hypothetical protein
MPKQTLIQTNFSAGELSPQALGRMDIARYLSSTKRMVNVISRTLGGGQKRYGTEQITASKFSDKRARLIPYIVNRDLAYVLEFGENYMRVFKTDGTPVMSGLSPYEIATPYNQAQVNEFDHAQSADEMFVFHQDIPIYRLRTFDEATWNLSPAPFTTEPFAEQGMMPAVALTLSLNTVGTGRTITAASAVFLASDVGRAIVWKAGIAIITAFTSTTVVTVTVNSIFEAAAIPTGVWTLDSSPQTTCTASAATPEGAAITLTLSADGWRADDVGKFVRINGGLVKITGFTSALIVAGTIIKELTSAVGSPALAWTLEASVWNGVNGYPRTGTLHEQRLIAAGTLKNQQTVWGSRTGEPLDFTIGVQDDDAFAFTLVGNNSQTNQINYVVSARNLLVLTYGGEYSMQAGVEKPISPTNVQIRAQSPHGAGNVKPVQVGRETLFAQRALRKIRAMGYRADEDGYRSPDITTLAEHITETGICCMALQQEPDPVLWVVLNNGRMVSVTFDRELDMIAWNQHETDGAFESVCVVPNGDHEQVWMTVRRVVNGAVVRYDERMRHDWYPIYGTAAPDVNAFPPQPQPFSWGFTLDCAKTFDDAVGRTVFTGLAHLNGKTVRCIADGVDMPPLVVAGGQITLPRPAKRVLIGLMFTPVIELLTPDTPGGSTLHADAMSTNKIVVRVYNTVGCTVDGDLLIPGRFTGPDELDFAPELFTGDKQLSNLGWTKGKAEIVISQEHPFPMHILALMRTITANAG